jgi:hypothetical protein
VVKKNDISVMVVEAWNMKGMSKRTCYKTRDSLENLMIVADSSIYPKSCRHCHPGSDESRFLAPLRYMVLC